MSYDHRRFDESEDDWDDEDDGPDEADDEVSDTIACSECGAEVYEDAVRCPVCGHYLTSDTRTLSGRPLWWVVLGMVGILAAILALSGFW